MNWKYSSRVIGFWLLTTVLFIVVQPSFKVMGDHNPASSAKYRAQTAEILYMGSSHSNTMLQPALIEEMTGLRGYDYGVYSARMDQLYYILWDYFLIEQPRYVVIETSSLISYQDAEKYQKYSSADRITNYRLKSAYIQEDIAPKYWLEAAFPILRNHARWKDGLDFWYKDIFRLGDTAFDSENQGFYAYQNVIAPGKYLIAQKNDFKNLAWTGSPEAVPTPDQEHYLRGILELCREYDVELILLRNLNIPSLKKGDFLWMEEFARENDLVYIDLNKDFVPEDIAQVDMADLEHFTQNGTLPVNIALARELSRSLGTPFDEAAAARIQNLYIEDITIQNDTQNGTKTVRLVTANPNPSLEVSWVLYEDDAKIRVEEFTPGAFSITFPVKPGSEYDLLFKVRSTADPQGYTTITRYPVFIQAR